MAQKPLTLGQAIIYGLVVFFSILFFLFAGLQWLACDQGHCKDDRPSVYQSRADAPEAQWHPSEARKAQERPRKAKEDPNVAEARQWANCHGPACYNHDVRKSGGGPYLPNAN